jgi:hypothetical protein
MRATSRLQPRAIGFRRMGAVQLFQITDVGASSATISVRRIAPYSGR